MLCKLQITANSKTLTWNWERRARLIVERSAKNWEVWCRKDHLHRDRNNQDVRGNDNPLYYSCLKNPVGREVRQAAVYGVTKNCTWLSGWERHWEVSFYKWIVSLVLESSRNDNHGLRVKDMIATLQVVGEIMIIIIIMMMVIFQSWRRMSYRKAVMQPL